MYGFFKIRMKKAFEKIIVGATVKTALMMENAMKHIRNFSFAWLLCCLLLVLPAQVGAHSVIPDGDPSEWTSFALPGYDNLGHLVRNTSLQGQYVWKDLVGDYRTDLGTYPDADITTLRITGDATDLSFFTNGRYWHGIRCGCGAGTSCFAGFCNRPTRNVVCGHVRYRGKPSGGMELFNTNALWFGNFE